MNKLTAEIARMDIGHLREHQANPHVGLSLREEKYLQALEVALPVLEQQESQCQKCGGTGLADSGGTQPWGEQILVECDCQFEQQEKGDDGWVRWHGGECPVPLPRQEVEYLTRLRNKYTTPAGDLRWYHEGKGGDIVAYRLIENDGREG